MLLRDENQLPTHVGPGTPMGELFRQFWIPALLSSELPAVDCAPLRVRLLGEDLIAFRDSSGRLGLLGNACSHRGASLFFGRNEENGLRCVYHGWKYDVAGCCVDMPNEPPESNFQDKIRHLAYPCRERNGVIWTYMGLRRARPAAVGEGDADDRVRVDDPGTGLPPLPDLMWNLVPESQRHIQLILRDCNWMQAMEGDIDPCHTSFLHRTLPGYPGDDEDPRGATRGPVIRGGGNLFQMDNAPVQEAVDTPWGVMIGSRRRAGPDAYQWRIYQALLPCHTFVGGGGSTSAWVPMDDEHVMKWRIFVFSDKELCDEERSVIEFIHGGYDPPSSDWIGRWRLAANMANDFFLDRERQRTQTFTGMPNSNNIHDAAVIESMGAVVDRTIEHLGTSDAGIIGVRRRWIEAARALRERGEVPAAVDDPSIFRVLPAVLTLPGDSNWREASRDLIKLSPEMMAG